MEPDFISNMDAERIFELQLEDRENACQQIDELENDDEHGLGDWR